MDIILKAVLNKVAVWKKMYANHEATADEINDRNWHGMCVVLTDRISELESQLAESDRALDCMTLAAGELQDLCDKLEAQLECADGDIARLTKVVLEQQKQLAAVRDPAERIKQWCEAYPIDIFPEPDLKLAHKALKSVGLTLGAVSASSMRHVLKGITGYIDQIEAAMESKQ